jgi:hypothetical protein
MEPFTSSVEVNSPAVSLLNWCGKIDGSDTRNAKHASFEMLPQQVAATCCLVEVVDHAVLVT